VLIEFRFDGAARQIVLQPSNKTDEQLLKLFAREAKTATLSAFGDKQQGVILAISDEKESNETNIHGSDTPQSGTRP
jgi:hypothetical protein